MSLKDRLSKKTIPNVNIVQEKIEPKYYETSEISQSIDSLGEIETLFADDEINSIHVVNAKNIFIERKGKKNKISMTYRDNVKLENVITKNIQFRGLQFDSSHPFVEFNHKLGINVIATLPPLSSNASMIIKCYKDKFADLKMLCETQAISKEVAIVIEALSSLKLNILIAGEKNTLKTTILSAIAKKVPKNNSAVMIDYSKELKPENPNIVTYDFKDYKNNNLIDYIILSNPDKLFLNDCDDINYFEQYLKRGYKGLCATIYANNANDILNKVDIKNFDVLIFTERKESKRYISSVSMIKDGEMKNIFYIDDELKHKSSGFVPDFYDDIKKDILSLSNAIFEPEYIHTYYQVIEDDKLHNVLKKNLNKAILNKFKKENVNPSEVEIENHSEDINTDVENTQTSDE